MARQESTAALFSKFDRSPPHMPLSVPNHVLTVERRRLAEFFLLFARIEFALKAAGYAKAGRWGAEVDWDKFASEVGSALFSTEDGKLQRAIFYLELNPPKQQKYLQRSLQWNARPAPQSYSRMRALVFYMQGVRNNLVHGAKFLAAESDDPNRDLKLLESVEYIFSTCLDCLPNVFHAFDSEVIR